MENPKSGVVSVNIDGNLVGFLLLDSSQLAALKLADANDFTEITAHKAKPTAPFLN